LEIVPEESWQYDTFLEEIEASMLRHLLERFENRPTHLATALRMNRATLRQKLRRCGLSTNLS
jgi:DNA-binding protein Fis